MENHVYVFQSEVQKSVLILIILDEYTVILVCACIYVIGL